MRRGQNINEPIWRAAAYIRLSKEDGDKAESNSVTNQRALLQDAAVAYGIPLCGEFVDDGWSGADFNRPGVQRMLAEVQAGRINCILVKDLSRFGRNYIETGRYLERIFPALGVRFLAVSESYDSHAPDQADAVFLPFQNLINDAYCLDSSAKIRSQLEEKRRRGEFVGAFAVYGYRRNPVEKHRLIPDPFAAETVRDIFRWRLGGMSLQGIADRLTEQCVPAPAEQQREIGNRYQTGFQLNTRSTWSGVAVGRILAEECYTGILTQGRFATPNHRIKTRLTAPESDWVRIPDAQEAIISPTLFRLTKQVSELPIRLAAGKKERSAFSGIVHCGDCGTVSIRKTTVANGKRYGYFVCPCARGDRFHSSHTLSEERLEKALRAILSVHLRIAISLERSAQLLQSEQNTRARRIAMRIKRAQDGAIQLRTRLTQVTADASAGRFSAAEEQLLKQEYHTQLTALETGLEILEQERTRPEEPLGFRIGICCLVEQITVWEGERIELQVRYQENLWAGIFLC